MSPFERNEWPFLVRFPRTFNDGIMWHRDLQGFVPSRSLRRSHLGQIMRLHELSWKSKKGRLTMYTLKSIRLFFGTKSFLEVDYWANTSSQGLSWFVSSITIWHWLFASLSAMEKLCLSVCRTFYFPLTFGASSDSYISRIGEAAGVPLASALIHITHTGS